MVKSTSFLLLFLGLMILCAVYAIDVPDVPEPTCAGGWNIHGVFYPREQGGCCRGYECCKYEGFKDNPICVTAPPTCSGIECCQKEEYKNTPLCAISSTPTQEDQTNRTGPSSCFGLECCQYEPYKSSLVCSISGYTPSSTDCEGIECCEYEKYKETPLCAIPTPSCFGLECCKYEAYKNTPLCIIFPTPADDSCTAPPPECPTGGWSLTGKVPMLLDPGIASGSKCRGACGPDCPYTCAQTKDQTHCISDSNGKCFYVCTYYNVLTCGLHEGCETHDDCYDACAADGEKNMCFPFLGIGLCHCGCDMGCFLSHGSKCLDWVGGRGVMDRSELYSSPPLRSGPFRSCPKNVS